MIRLLSIGNSFSEDAQRYLHALSQAEGCEIYCVNMVIGGCSLKTHWEKVQCDAAEYYYILNGKNVMVDGKALQTNLAQIIAVEKWDVVTLQQCSPDSGCYDTYQPYLNYMADYVRKHAPGAKLMIQQTWAYEKDCDYYSSFSKYQNDQQVMYESLKAAYNQASQAVDAPLIRTGDMIQALRKKGPFLYGQGGRSLCRDGFHLSLDYGRYAAAAIWYAQITGRMPKGVPIALDGQEKSEDELLQLICCTVREVLGE
ncbi:MAG: DUF4886 domain-containing protein [Clostridiales bacterium]|nr:DUF4886 domain-containing protein [Clostridiales bacterium]